MWIGARGELGAWPNLEGPLFALVVWCFESVIVEPPVDVVVGFLQVTPL